MATTRHHCTYRGKLITIVFRSGRRLDTRFIYSTGPRLITEAGRFRWHDVDKLLHRLATGRRAI